MVLYEIWNNIHIYIHIYNIYMYVYISLGAKMSIFLSKKDARWGVIIWNAEKNPGFQGSVRHSTFKLISFENGKYYCRKFWIIKTASCSNINISTRKKPVTEVEQCCERCADAYLLNYLPNVPPSYYYEFKREFHVSIKLIRISTALWGKSDRNFFKLKSVHSS
jgi:hypothetical protein